MAGSLLFGGVLAASLIAGILPASATAVVSTISVGSEPVGVSVTEVDAAPGSRKVGDGERWGY